MTTPVYPGLGHALAIMGHDNGHTMAWGVPALAACVAHFDAATLARADQQALCLTYLAAPCDVATIIDGGYDPATVAQVVPADPARAWDWDNACDAVAIGDADVTDHIRPICPDLCDVLAWAFDHGPQDFGP